MSAFKYSVCAAPFLYTPILSLTVAAENETDFLSSEQSENPHETVDTVVVTGNQRSRMKALSLKRESAQIMEALGTDELGQLPDKNVGESLRRLPGVTMLVEKGEGRFIQIRGIHPSLNNVTLNGVGLGSPESDDGGRLAPMDIISGSILSHVTVIKTPTPDMDGQGIGGTVNVETKMPFDRPDNFYGYVTGRYGYEEVRPESEAYGGHDPYGLDLTISGKSSDHSVGWLLSGSLSSREYIAQGIYQDDWTPVAPGVSLPEEVKNNYYVIGRDRVNLSAALEFRPTDNAQYYVQSFFAKWDEYQHRNRYQQALTEGIVASTSTSDPDRVSANVRLEDATKNILSVAVGGENYLGMIAVDYELRLNRNELDEPNSYWEFRSGRIFGPNSWAVDGDGIVTITPDIGTPDRQEPKNIDLRRTRFQTRALEEDSVIATFNAEWDTSQNSRLKSGIKLIQTEREHDYNQSRYDGGSSVLTLGTDPSFTSGGFINNVAAGNVPNIWMNVDAMNAFFNDPANASFFELNQDSTFADNFASDYALTETISAAYVMATSRIQATEVIYGVRAERTDVESEGFVRQPDNTARLVKADGDYTNVLPALLVNHSLNEQTILRAAITRGLGRPDYDAIAPIANFEEETGSGTLKIGNPNLEARESWNYDIALEWYPNDLSLLSVALFNKKVENEIVGINRTFVGQADIDAALANLGLTGAIDTAALDDLTVSTTTNGEESDLTGIEFNGQTQFGFLRYPLSGLGIAASVALIDAEIDVERNGNVEQLPLPGQAETSYNVTLFFQNQGWDLALSYAYSDSFLTDIENDPSADLYQGEFGRWDFRGSYDVTAQTKVFVEVVNINDEPTTEFQGGIESQNTEHEYVGRTVYVGVTAGF